MPCRHPPELLDPAKAAFDQITVLVMALVKFPLLPAVAFQGDDRLGFAFLDLFQHGIRIVGLVGQYRTSNDTIQQRNGLGHVMHLAAGQAPLCQLAKPLDHGMDLGALAAPRAAKGLLFALFWCARRMSVYPDNRAVNK